ncbi:MAG: phage baseplate assembly protein V [Ramlibacter sp.]|nr:phage baseplate assembly protein V [Ramlibacter sp.]
MIADAVKRAVGDAMRGMRQAFRALVKVDQLERGIQLASGEGLDGEALKGLELFQQFGLTSVLPAGTQVIVVPLGGRTSHAVIVASEQPTYRLALDAAGEMAIYNQWGDYVWLKQDGQMKVKAATRVEIDAPLVHLTGNLTVAGRVDVVGDVVGEGVSLPHHVHSGIAPGPGDTGGPH